MYMTTYTTRLYNLQKNHKEFMYCLHIFRSIHLDRYTHLTDFQLYHCSTVGIQKVAYEKAASSLTIKEMMYTSKKQHTDDIIPHFTTGDYCFIKFSSHVYTQNFSFKIKSHLNSFDI